MKITMLTFGSRGDVEPYLALAVGLQKRGHAVTIVAPDKYRDWIASYQVSFHPLSFDSSELILSRERPARGTSLAGRWRFHRHRWNALLSGIVSNIDEFYGACEGADLIFEAGFAPGGTDISQVLNLPLINGHAFPTQPTSEFPAFALVMRHSFGRRYNRFSQRLLTQLQWAISKRPRNVWRARRGLPPVRSFREYQKIRDGQRVPTLYAFSEHVLKRPGDWPSSSHVTGYWPLTPSKTWEAPADLQEFLNAGPAPVFIGFGSMTGKHAVRRTTQIVDAIERRGLRAIIYVGGGKALARVPASNNIHFIENAPFAWLFPKMAAVVHHGGAGTTSATLLAGVPSIVVPANFDQFSWAAVVDKLGVGLRAGSLDRFNVTELDSLIARLVADDRFRSRAATIRDQIVAEDGISEAIRIIEKHMASDLPS